MNLEIMQVLVVNSGHITKEESELFEAASLDTTGNSVELPGNMSGPMSWQYGWMFYIGERGDSVTTEGMSPGLAAVIELAWNEKIEWVRFDCDGPKLDNIPTYDW